MRNKLKDFWFMDTETGEEFFVETESVNDALTIANYYFKSPILLDIITPDEADILGYDTY